MTYSCYQLGEICSLVKGSFQILKTEPGPYPLVVTAEYRRSASTYQMEGPAVCVPLISSTGHGDAALHRVHYQEGKFALANLLVALVPRDPRLCDAKYLYHLLMAKKEEYLVPLMRGTANVSLKEHDIAGVTVPLPPIKEQHRIVARIEELNAKVEEVRGLEQAVAVGSKRTLRSLYSDITRSVNWQPMHEVAPLTRRPVSVDVMGEYHELGIRSFGKGTFHKPPVDGTTLGSKRIFRIEPGDLVFNIVFAWEGAVAVAEPKDRGRVGSHRFLTCVPKEGIATSSFLRFHFLTDHGLEQLGKASPGGAGRNRTLGIQALESILVPVPPIERQLWFDSIQAKVDALKSVQAETSDELDALLPSILDRAFKGEL